MTETSKSKLTLAIEAAELSDKLMGEVTAADIHSAFAAAFAEAPKIVGFTWIQHTPYFNDGDPCVFNAWTEQGCRSMLDASTLSMDWLAGRGPTREEVTASRAQYGYPPETTPEEEKDNYGDGYFYAEFNDRNLKFGEYGDYVPGKGCEIVGADPDDVAQARRVADIFHAIPRRILQRCLGDHRVIFVWRGGLGWGEYHGD